MYGLQGEFSFAENSPTPPQKTLNKGELHMMRRMSAHFRMRPQVARKSKKILKKETRFLF